MRSSLAEGVRANTVGDSSPGVTPGPGRDVGLPH